MRPAAVGRSSLISMIAILQNVWWLLVLIGVMILIHELGHYWAARFFDVRVEAFSFGFGPRLFGFRKGETDFRFSAILFGGYVKMSGEQPGEDTTNDPRAFSSKPRWQRLIIAFAGPAMNIVLAVGLLTGLFMVRFPRVANFDAPATIGYIEKGSAAEKAGLREGDRIAQIDGQVNPIWEDVARKELASAKKAVTVGYVRDGQRYVTTVTPVLDEKTGVGNAGWDQQNDVEIAGVKQSSGAEKGGMKPGDEVVSVNGVPIHSTFRLHDQIRNSDGKPVQLVIRRNCHEMTTTVTPALSPDVDGTQRYMIGVELARRVVITKLSFPEALRESVRQNVKSATLIY